MPSPTPIPDCARAHCRPPWSEMRGSSAATVACHTAELRRAPRAAQTSKRANERDDVRCEMWINRANTRYSLSQYVCVDER
jgi:hypothetical protein